MDRHDSTVYPCRSLSLLHLSLLSLILTPNHTDPMAPWHLCKNKPSDLRLCDHFCSWCPASLTAYVIKQPLRYSSQSAASQLACVHFCSSVHLPDCPSVSACLTVSLSLSQPASLSYCCHVWCWQTLKMPGLLFRLDGNTGKTAYQSTEKYS